MEVLFHNTDAGDKVANNDAYFYDNLLLPYRISYKSHSNKLFWIKKIEIIKKAIIVICVL